MALESMGEVWRRASLAQRVVLLGIVLGFLGGGSLLVNWARQPNLSLLYSGLAPEEAAGIVEKVRDQGIPYELKQGGTAVYVPDDKVYSLRLTMASAGLPTGDNRGYQILDQDSLGESPFAERVRYNRAIEGEIARSVQTLEGVTAARVHIVRPEAALFRQDNDGSSATVVVKLRGGGKLGGANVAAIVHLVAGAVEGLRPEKVVVVDSQGTLLSGEGTNGVNAKLTSVLEQKRQLEEYLSQKAERQLALVLGPSRATVQVAVEMDTTGVESETKRFGPDKPVPSREMIKESKTTEPPAAAGGTSGTTSDSTTETEYKISEVVERKTTLPGEVKSKTVSVVVDLSGPKAEGDAGSRKLLQVTDVEEIVKTALGLRVAGEGGADGSGTDKLTVKEASFYQPPEVAALTPQEEGLFSKDFILEIAKRSSLGLLVVGALLALRMFGGGKRRAGLPAGAAAALAGQAGHAASGLLPLPGQGDPELLKAQITKALQDNPEEVKRLFLSWVQSGKGEA